MSIGAACVAGGESSSLLSHKKSKNPAIINFDLQKMFGRFFSAKTTLVFGAVTGAVILPCTMAFDNFTTYPANNPIEDRYCFFELGGMSGGAVFDGHGGA